VRSCSAGQTHLPRFACAACGIGRKIEVEGKKWRLCCEGLTLRDYETMLEVVSVQRLRASTGKK
jgi:hypothetical protein